MVIKRLLKALKGVFKNTDRTVDTSSLRAGEIHRNEPGLYAREDDTPTGGNIRWR